MVPQFSVNDSILVADSDEAFVATTKIALEEAGFDVFIAHDGESALIEARKNPALILINTNLSILDGWRTVALLKNSQSTATIPIIFLADSYSESDEVLSFELGGLNFLVKPVATKIIIARIKNLINGRHKSPVNTVKSGSIIKVGDIEIDVDRLTVKVGGRYIALTSKEFNLLMFLARNKDCVVNRGTIYKELWGKILQTGDRNIDVVILRIRNKLGNTGKNIKTIPSLGYKLES